MTLGHLKTRQEKIADQYAEFFDPKQFAAHNTLTEILNRQIPQEVSEYQYGLGLYELKKGIKYFKKKHPNFPCGI